jgi:hypothetical protein
MRFYGAIQAFRENKYPDNTQIDETLTYVIEHSPLDESKLSYEGRKLINDVRDILETVPFHLHPLASLFNFDSHLRRRAF